MMEEKASSEARRKRVNTSQSVSGKPQSSDSFSSPSPILHTRHPSREQSAERGNTLKTKQTEQECYINPMEY